MLHLHTHSVYSYKKSTAKIEDIIVESKRQGESTFCITDYGSLTSFVKAIALAEKYKMKFIPGCEIFIRPQDDYYKLSVNEEIAYVTKEMRLKRTTPEMFVSYEKRLGELSKVKSVDNHSLIILAKNDVGVKNLINIFSNEKEENDAFLSTNEMIFNETNRENSDGLIILSGGINSEILYYIQIGEDAKAEDLIVKYRKIFGDNFYAQIEYSSCKGDINGMSEVEAMKTFITLAEKHNVPFIATNDVLYVSKGQKADYRLYRNIMTPSRVTFNGDNNYMMEEDALKALMYAVYPKKAIDDGFANIKKIEWECEHILAPKSPGLVDCSEELIELCNKGWKKIRKGGIYSERSKKRYEYELSVINGKNFSQYFIKVRNIINLAKELGILIGPGRGSGAGSEICYLIGITAVDPLKYNLFFERFLNPSRNGMPDIDIDMASVPMGDLSVSNEKDDDAEETVIDSASRNLLMDELIKRGYFKFSGFMQNEVRASSLVLFKNLAKYYGIIFSETNKISTDSTYAEKLKEKIYTGWLPQAVSDFGLEWEDVWEPINERMQFCYDLAGIPNNTSVTASGVVMSDYDAVLPMHNGIIAYNGGDLESLDYIKFDLLSITTLNQIQYFKGLDIKWDSKSEPEVWKTFGDGDTDFVFQFASPGMKGILTKVCSLEQNQNIETLAEINALYRPGPIEMGLVEKYISIKTGKQIECTLGDEVISRILKKEFGDEHTGLIIYQEDVMKICQIGAGFTLAEADDIRKAMGKKKIKLLLTYKEKFIKGWKFEGDAELIWKDLEGFGRYAFNKSHAVSYAIIAYEAAELWTYQKEKFLEYGLNYDTKKRYSQSIEKCKQLGMEFTYPILNSMVGSKFTVNDKKVFIPGESEKNYESYVDFLFGADTAGLGSLIYKGVCDKLTKDRYALADLATTLLAKPKANAIYMEPAGTKFTKLTEILDGLKICGAVVDWKKEHEGIRVAIKRGRGNPSEVFFHNDNSDYVRAYLIKYDLKMFGSVRNGIISSLPYINTTGIERNLNNMKEKYRANGKETFVFKAMQNELKDYMREYFSNKFKNTFEDVYAILDDVIYYDNSTKLVLNFNDKQDIFYVKGQNVRKVKLMSKKALIKMKMEYSPFISRRKEEFIYDFDILEINEVINND